MPRRSLLVLAAVAILAAALLTWWLTRAPTVPAVTVQIAPLVRTLQFSARVATLSRVDVGSTLTGRVLVVAVDEGAQVRQGEVLVRLETDELRAALAQAQASERQAAARLAGLRSTGRSSAQAAVAQADSVLAAALADLQRTQSLVARGFLSDGATRRGSPCRRCRRAQQASARAQLAANAEQGTEVVQAQAQLALASSATAAAQARLAQAVLLGTGRCHGCWRAWSSPARSCSPGTRCCGWRWPVRCNWWRRSTSAISDNCRSARRPACWPTPSLASASGARAVDFAAGRCTARRDRGQVLAAAGRPPAFLREDMTLSVEVETARRQAALVVPVDALRGDQAATDAVVLVERDGRVEERPVRVGLRTLEAAEVLAGLSAGETVLRGSTLKPGSRVRAAIADSTIPAAALPGLRNGTREDAGSAMTNAMGR
jgi:HlyD family secretion protein